MTLLTGAALAIIAALSIGYAGLRLLEWAEERWA